MSVKSYPSSHLSSTPMNLHTHTYRCKHAQGDVDDYCRAATEAGLTTLGISDHTALPDDRWPDERMAYADLPAYMDCITQAQTDHPGLRVLRAVECECHDDYAGYYREELLGGYGCDYLIGSVHYFPLNGEWLSPFVDMSRQRAMAGFTDYFIKSMAGDLFTFMAHPDNFAASLLDFDEQARACTRAMCEAAVDRNMAWEINGRGMSKAKIRTPAGLRAPYPLAEFWDIVAEYPIRVVVNSDAHKPREVAANLAEAASFARQRGLEILGPDDLPTRG